MKKHQILRLNYGRYSSRILPAVIFLFCVAIGLWFAKRPETGLLAVRCAPGATVNATMTFGRFQTDVLSIKSVENGPRTSAISDREFEIGSYSAKEGWSPLFSLGSLSLINNVQIQCEGFSELQIHGKVKLFPNESGFYEIPNRYFSNVLWKYWIFGFILFYLILLTITKQLSKSFTGILAPVERFLPWVNLLYVISIFIIFFPSYIGPYNPIDILIGAQQNKFIAWEGSLYSLIITALVSFIPKVPIVIIIQNFVVFLVLQKITSLGRTLKEKVLLTLFFPLLCIVSPVVAFYTQNFDRAVLACWIFVFLLLEIFSVLLNRDTGSKLPEKKFYQILSITLGLCLIRYEYFLICLLIPIVLFKNHYQKKVFAGILILSGLLGPSILDSYERDQTWKTRYYIVSLWPYFQSLSALNKLDIGEKTYVSQFYDLESATHGGSLWTSLKHDYPYPGDSISVLNSILAKYTIQSPSWFFSSLIQKANNSLMMDINFDAGKGHAWVYSNPVPENYNFIEKAIFSITSGAVKLPGDPFSQNFTKLFKIFTPQWGFYVAYGLIFIAIGSLTFIWLPASAYLCWSLILKYFIVALLAPASHFAYLFDLFFCCALIPILMLIEISAIRFPFNFSTIQVMVKKTWNSLNTDYEN